MKISFHLLLAIQLVLMTSPLQAQSKVNCDVFTRGVFENFDPKVSVGGKYHRNKSLPWLIKHSGHYPSKLTKRAVIEEQQFFIAVPLNLLGEKTATFDDYFLKLKYKYGNVPTAEGVINNNNIAFLDNIEIVDFFDTPQLNNERQDLTEAFAKVKALTRELVRKKDAQFINLQITEELTVPVIPFFRQTTVDDYSSFMDLFFFTSKYDLLRSFKNKRINLENKTIRKLRGLEPKNKVARSDQSSLTQIDTYRQYEIRLKKLSLEKFIADVLDRTVYTFIGYVMIPLAIGSGIIIKFGQNKLKMTIPGIGEEEIQKEEIKAVIEKKLKEVDINQTFKDLLREDPEFRKAVEQSGVSKDTIFDVEVIIDDKPSANKSLKISLEGVTKDGDKIKIEDSVDMTP